MASDKVNLLPILHQLLKTKNEMKSWIVILVLLVVNGFACIGQKPNIVLMLIDDMGWRDVSYMGSEYYETPNIDRLANAGMKFTNAYANAANCAPTRASLLSGQYTPRHGVYNVGTRERGKSENRRVVSIPNSASIALEKITIAEALKSKGYKSAAIGKWHVGHSPLEQGFDFSIDRDAIGYKGHFNKETGDYLTDRLTDEAVGFIKRNQHEPFFLYLAHHAVHTPIQAKQELIERYTNKTTDGCHDNAKYAAMIHSVDESVGKINKTLKELGLEDNTMLIFVSDNGGYGPATCMKPLRGGKGMYYEGGIREPMFVFWPDKVKAGSTCDVPVITTDLYPTFLDITGAELPKNYPLDGKSIKPLLTNNEKLFKREELFWHFPCYLQSYGAMKEESRDPAFRTRPVSVIRKGKWKLFLYHEEWILDGGKGKMFENNSVELYDLNKDLSENMNLINKKRKKAESLVDDLLNWMENIDAPLPAKANSKYMNSLNNK
jgi:arylsulfatase A-like enzyme